MPALNHLQALLEKRRSIRRYSETALSSEVMTRILFAGQGITSPDGKRTVPSAHALYPIRLFVLVRRVENMVRGLYRYDVEAHELIELHEDIPDGALLSAALGDD